MALLAKIPLLPALLDGNEEERARLEVFCDKSPSSDISLLHWVSSKEPEHSLEDVVEKCKELLVKVGTRGNIHRSYLLELAVLLVSYL